MLTVLLKILFKCGLFVGGQNDTFAHPQTFLGGAIAPPCPPAITPLTTNIYYHHYYSLRFKRRLPHLLSPSIYGISYMRH